MIAVIADDFTGAAEIGGVGLRYGLNVLIETEVNCVEGVDLLVIATDTRSLGAEEAYEEVIRITTALTTLEPVFIFKKIDSVLRGHVARELEAQMFVTKKDRAVIVAANPDVGRTIVEGRYFVDSLPLHETSFADDPDFPVNSADVTAIVKPSKFAVISIGLNSNLAESGMMIADANSPEELYEWAARVDHEMVVAGGSGFFDALLGTMYTPSHTTGHPELSFGEGSLFIFGSKYPKQSSILEKFNENKVVRMNMPEDIYFDSGLREDLLEEWSNNIIGQLSKGKSVMITIDHEPVNEEDVSVRLRENIGRLVAKVEHQFELNDLFIEGGATTSVILKHLNITKLVPFSEADFGVIQMKAAGYPHLCVTTKPGSYLWPDHLVFEQVNPTIS